MRKTFTLAIGLSFVFGMSAGTPGHHQSFKEKGKNINRFERLGTIQSLNRNKKAQAPETVENGMIINVEGTSKVYSKDCEGYNYGAVEEMIDLASEIVKGDDNTVYFYDIISDSGLGTFTKGVIENDKVKVSLPQTLYAAPGEGYEVIVALFEMDEESGDWKVADVDSIEYLIDSEDDMYILEMPGEEGQYMLGLGYTDDDSWAGYGEFSQRFYQFPYDNYNIPEGLEIETYVIDDGLFGHPIDVAFDNDVLYLRGMSTMLPRGVIKCTLEGNKAQIPVDQLVGVYSTYAFYTKFLEFDPNVGSDGSYSQPFIFAPDDTEYYLDVDREGKRITPSDPSIILALNASLDEVLSLELYMDYDIYYQSTYDGTPVKPDDLGFFDDYFSQYGYYSFMFVIPNFSTEGKVLKTEDLYYRIYVDHELFEFMTDWDFYQYIGIEGIVTDIPFNFNNGNDLYSWSAVQREVGLYSEGISYVGVQSVYKYEGVETVSDIVTLNIETGEVTTEPGAGIQGVDNFNLISTEYYDLSGRRISHPTNGIFIKKDISSNGEIKVSKTIIK